MKKNKSVISDRQAAVIIGVFVLLTSVGLSILVIKLVWTGG